MSAAALTAARIQTLFPGMQRVGGLIGTSVSALFLLVIAGIIAATWMPAIYTSQWFQNNHWVRRHLLHGN